jgi:hypothetical protein
MGVILYRCLAGRLPFQADSAGELIAKLMREQAPSFSEACPDLPAGVAAATVGVGDDHPRADPLASEREENVLGRVYNGPATVKVGDSYLEPDIFFIRRENERFILERYVDCAPDFVIQVVSASTRSRDLGEKRAKYLEAGVAEYWAIDYLRGEVRLWRKRSRDYANETLKSGLLASSAVPGFQVDVAWLWQRPLPRISASSRW